MNARLLQELEHLSAADKRALAEALIFSADSEAQRDELRSRLAYHRASPSESGATFSQLKAKLLAVSR